MILPEDTPGLKEAIARNAKRMENGEWPEPLPIPSVVSEDDLDQLDAIQDGALVERDESK